LLLVSPVVAEDLIEETGFRKRPGANAPAKPVVVDILQRSGLGGGICVLPELRDTSLAMDVAKHPNWIVYARSGEAALIQKLQQMAISAGLLNQKLYAAIGDDAQLPFAKYSVDLIVLEQGKDVSDDTVARLRDFLTPRRGRIMIQGGSKGKDVGNGWKMLQASPREGGDQWTHRFYGPNNNLLSKDTALKAPFAIQWLALPIHDGYWGVTSLAEGGRFYTLASSIEAGSVDPGILRARSQGNGSILWERPLRPIAGTTSAKKSKIVFMTAGRCVAVEGGVLITDGNDVLFLDGETGKELKRITGPKPDGQIRWMGMQDKMLILLSGPPDDLALAHDSFPQNHTARVFAAYDLTSYKKVWQFETAGDVDERMVATTEGRLFYYATKKWVAARNLKTNKIIWAQADQKVLAAMHTTKHYGRGKAYDPIKSQQMMITAGGIVLLPSKIVGNGVALSQKDGSFLWQDDRLPWMRTTKVVIAGGKLLSSRGEYDLSTGKKILNKTSIANTGCGPSTCTPTLSIDGNGGVRKLGSADILRNRDLKTGCDVGTTVADGLGISHSSTCLCNMEVYGYRAFGHYKVPTELPNPGVSARAQPVKETAADDQDWPQMQHDVKHKNSTPVSVGLSEPKLLWQWKPSTPISYDPSRIGRFKGRDLMSGTDFHPTSLVTAGENAWFADACGVLRCISTNAGKEVWNFALSARTKQPPAFWQGRVYVGDDSGRVVCVDASNGKKLWDYFAAPDKRQILVFDALENTWPINSGVLLDKGIAYCVAGFHSSTGVCVSAIDAKTGALKWRNFVKDKNIKGNGRMTIANGKLWLASPQQSLIMPASFDLQTGELTKVTEKQNMDSRHNAMMVRGSSITALSDKWLLFGGRRILDTHATWNSYARYVFMHAFTTEYPARSKLAGVELFRTNTIPAWDDNVIITGTGNPEQVPSSRSRPENHIAAISRPKLLEGFDNSQKLYKREKKMPTASPFKYPGASPTKLCDIKTIPSELFVWGPVNQPNCGLVLTADTIVLLGVIPPKTKSKTAKISTWNLRALSRKDGQELWDIKLPAQPVFDSLSVGRNGRIFVPLRNGSIACYAK